MDIVIDTNIFVQDFFLEKPSFQVLLEKASIVPATINVPEVVLEEIVNKYRERLEDKFSQFKKLSDELLDLTKRSIIIDLDIDQEIDNYKKYLTNELDRNGVKINGYPRASHKQIVGRALARKKPFKNNGSGYRDSLIWECVKEVHRWGDNPVAFITNNIHDFCDSNGNLDPDLSSEVRNTKRLTIFRQLRDFNERHIVPKLQKLEDVRLKLQAEQLSSFEVGRWIKERLLGVLGKYDLECVLAGFPECGSAWISNIIELNDIKFIQAVELDDGKKLLTLSVNFEASCHISSSWNDYSEYYEVREFWGNGIEQFESISTSINETINITVDLVLNEYSHEIDSEEIVRISAGYGEIDFGS